MSYEFFKSLEDAGIELEKSAGAGPFLCEYCRTELSDYADVEDTIVGYFCSEQCLHNYAEREGRCPECLNELKGRVVRERYGEYFGHPAYKTYMKYYCIHCGFLE